MAIPYAAINPELEKKQKAYQELRKAGQFISDENIASVAKQLPDLATNTAAPAIPNPNSVGADLSAKPAAPVNAALPALPVSSGINPAAPATTPQAADIPKDATRLGGQSWISPGKYSGDNPDVLAGLQRIDQGVKGNHTGTMSVMDSSGLRNSGGLPSLEGGMDSRVTLSPAQNFSRDQINDLVNQASNQGGYTSEGSADNYRRWHSANKTLDQLLGQNQANDKLTAESAQQQIGQNEFDTTAKQTNRQQTLNSQQQQQKTALDFFRVQQQGEANQATAGIQGMRESRAMQKQQAELSRPNILTAKTGEGIERPYKVDANGDAEYIDIKDKGKQKDNLQTYQQMLTSPDATQEEKVHATQKIQEIYAAMRTNNG